MFQGLNPGAMDSVPPVIPKPGPRCEGVVYTPSAFVLPIGVPMTPAVPAITGAAPRIWYRKTPLPAGLLLDNSTGTLSGTPTVLQPVTPYTILAVHSDDVLQVGITISVV